MLDWRCVQEKTGTDILTIVMNLKRGIASASETMDSIAEHCIACHELDEAEIERLKNWVNDLQSGMYVNCVYCGHRYGPSEKTPVSMAEMLRQHIEVCPEHPMSKCKKENERLQEEVKVLREMLTGAHAKIAGTIVA
jgi:hypothetical protein